ncbi:hypothetical protein CH330_02980 [candidate division WOR-3 bacterium JGI_Cruoil_03_51_56]|uniref:Metallo-beta-lactamase domain-containing protein n=1 Tax=candidate division WOR-3 bacterium JGI_Cruoil_03_51_56 TaxID=1973747 RepID=A0A235BXW7_UNCW3|nr:MAG: hypothetical protein CH330_02980 [candidate division WOR-3 bacterium JGI_Cruoil_03_51_56]
MKNCVIWVFLELLLVSLACRAPQPEGTLDIVFFDVGQGNAILIRTPDKRACLIDGGPTFAGANEICPILDSLGITELDYSIATNYTEGRIGGLDEVIRYLGGEEGVLFYSYDRGRTIHTKAFSEYQQAVGSRRKKIRVGEIIEIGDVTIWCLASNGRVLESKRKHPKVEQDRSIALLVSYHNFDMLITSDLNGVAGNNRLNLGSKLAEVTDEVELLSVGNYGSASAVSYRMVQQIHPVVSVISVGKNDLNLPDQKLVNRLTRRHRKVYQTNRTDSDLIPFGKGRIVGHNIWVRVNPNWYTVAGDTFRIFRQ